MRSTTLLLALAAAPSSSSSCDDVVGTWSGATPALPNGKLPASPLLGNGYLGALVSTEPWVWLPENAAGAGPGNNDSDTRGLHFWLGSNAMWSVQPASAAADLGPTAKSTRVALGGLSLYVVAAGLSAF